jgi:hypothetical protein
VRQQRVNKIQGSSHSNNKRAIWNAKNMNQMIAITNDTLPGRARPARASSEKGHIIIQHTSKNLHSLHTACFKNTSTLSLTTKNTPLQLLSLYLPTLQPTAPLLLLLISRNEQNPTPLPDYKQTNKHLLHDTALTRSVYHNHSSSCTLRCSMWELPLRLELLKQAVARHGQVDFICSSFVAANRWKKKR